MDPRTLPVYREGDRILRALEDHQVVVVESPTGSGKTTQIPLILHEAGWTGRGVVGVTQPRRIAAVSVSEFIARQLGVTIPGLVGYKMRFEDRTVPSTLIKIMTDGILLQEMKGGGDLAAYGVIVVDEAHERSLNIDFILGLLKGILARRPGFRVIVSSATINVGVFSAYFDDCPVVSIDAPMFPVELLHDPPEVEGDLESLLDKVAQIVRRIEGSGGPGDVLVFLQGELAIKECIQRLAEADPEEHLQLLPLYARLAREEQQRVFGEYPGKRKVIVATNIAETSVTIDGVRWVVDSGLAKLNHYNPKTFTESLVELPVSRASCNQRRGRAGRTAPGTCIRLYGKADYEARPLYTTEEIHRTDLSEVLLRMAELGISEFEDFDFISPPSREGIVAALETLRLLGALDEDRRLTGTGRMMCLFPILPKHSRIIVEAIRAYPRVISEVVIAATFLSVNSPFLLPAGEELEARRAHHAFRDPLGDFVSYLRLHAAFTSASDRRAFAADYYLDLRVMNEIVSIVGQLEEIVSAIGVPIGSGGSRDDYLVAIARGLIQFVCVRSGRGVYRSLTADRIHIHPGSVMFHEDPQYIVAGEIVHTSRMYARSVSPLRRGQLARVSPLLADSLLGGRPLELVGEGAAPQGKRRDFTNRIRIGSVVFPITVRKGGRKVVQLEWEKLREVLRELEPAALHSFKDLRGTVVLDGREIFSGMKLKSILQAAPHLRAADGVWEDWPARSFLVPGDEHALVAVLPRLLGLCPMKKGSRRLGLLTLHTNEAGRYWFKPEKSLGAARLESLGSMETLADLPPDVLSREERERVSAQYHHLSDMLEEEDEPAGE